MSAPNPERPPLLYFPGLDGTGRLLHRQSGLQQAYRVESLAYDQEAPQTYEQIAELAADRLQALGGGRPGVLLAESFGGASALTLTLRRPELVERMVLCNTFAHFPRSLRLRLAARLGPWLPRRPAHPATRPLRGRFFFSPEISEQERREWWERTADVPLRAFGYRLRLVCGLDLRSKLGEIAVPTLVIAAPDDRVVPARCGRELAERLPQCRLIEPRVGHAALIHPRIDIAQLLADPANWPF
ncbi:alpha/beta fold hydrolase [soil metagenome]